MESLVPSVIGGVLRKLTSASLVGGADNAHTHIGNLGEGAENLGSVIGGMPPHHEEVGE